MTISARRGPGLIAPVRRTQLRSYVRTSLDAVISVMLEGHGASLTGLLLAGATTAVVTGSSDAQGSVVLIGDASAALAHSDTSVGSLSTAVTVAAVAQTGLVAQGQMALSGQMQGAVGVSPTVVAGLVANGTANVVSGHMAQLQGDVRLVSAATADVGRTTPVLAMVSGMSGVAYAQANATGAATAGLALIGLAESTVTVAPLVEAAISLEGAVVLELGLAVAGLGVIEATPDIAILHVFSASLDMLRVQVVETPVDVAQTSDDLRLYGTWTAVTVAGISRLQTYTPVVSSTGFSQVVTTITLAEET